MSNKTMKTLTFGNVTYEIFDEKARNHIEELSTVIADDSANFGINNIVGLKGFYIKAIVVKVGQALGTEGEKLYDGIQEIFLTSTQVKEAPPLFLNFDENSLSYRDIHTGQAVSISDLQDDSISTRELGYEVGNKINIILPNDHLILCGSICNFGNYHDGSYQNAITLKDSSINADSLLSLDALKERWNNLGIKWTSFADAIGVDDYTFSVPMQPTIGVINITRAGLASGMNNIAAGAFSDVSGAVNLVAGNFGHAEGQDNIAGYNAHAEGAHTQALGKCSHTEGNTAFATANNAHAEGDHTKATANQAHAEGRQAEANGVDSHAEGFGTKANGTSSHAEGERTSANGFAAHSEGHYTTATGTASHAEGGNHNPNGTKVTSAQTLTLNDGSTVSVLAPKAEGVSSHAEGGFTLARAHLSHAEGYLVAVTGKTSHGEGWKVIVEGESAHGEGYNTRAFGESSHSEGHGTNANGRGAHAEGSATIASGEFSHSEGQNTTAKGLQSHAEGNSTIASGKAQHVEGKYNLEDTKFDGDGYGTYVHIVGNGTLTNRANCHTLDWKGNAWYQGSVASNGADYAEFFEWEDGNPNNEDRVGFLVTLNGEKIKLANSGDQVLGIVSATAAILGDNYECEWNGKYITDDFGRSIYEDVEEFEEIENKETGEIEKVSVGRVSQRKLNPEYNPEKEYVNRANRAEWDTVGMIGKLYLRDDGTCEVNQYATVGSNGVATASTELTNMRVLSRVNENVVRVLLK